MAENDRDSNITPFDRHQTLHITESYFFANNGEEVLQKLQRLVTNIKWSPDDVSVLFDALLERFKSASANDNSHLFTWLMQMLHCIEVNYITSGWRSKSRKTLRELLQDKNVTDEELKKCLAKDEEKTLDEIIEEIRCEKLNQVDEKLLKDVKDIVSSVDETLTTHSDGSQQSKRKQALREICEAVHKTAKYRPRLTQMVSWCLMALSSTTGRFIQVGTGEGKSCIVAMFAAFRAMTADKVDIMSSSSVLAQRDLGEWEKFYQELKISVDCNISKDNAALKKCYECQVVYGTVEEFAGDWLRHHFHRMDIFGKRKFQCAIVDEVDSLMLDKGHHVVYLSSEMPALRHLNPLLAFIWATVNQFEGDIKYPDKSSRVKAAEKKIRAALRFTPCDLNDSDSLCYIPGFLSDLVQSKLKVWIENAFHAQTMETGQEYVLETHGIVPVDYKCTGVVENFRQWSDGLHQFLEMKHGFKLNDMTAITNYMSNVSLLQKYGSQIYGMSGTLGQQAETEYLQKIYKGIQTCQIPYFVRRKLFEVEGVVAIDANEWVQKICDVVAEQTKTKPFRSQRAVLVICETIKWANTLHRALGDKVPQKMLYVNNNMDNSAIFAKNLEPGDVIIATNLAGRGTDLKVSDSVKTAGGLLVVQTFLPTNARVEAQAFGRAARQGSPGSAQLIVCSSHLPEQQLVLTRKRFSIFDEMSNITSFKQNEFGIHFRQYVKSYTDDKRKRLSELLSHILTEKSDSDIMTAKKLRDDSVAEALSSYSETHIPNMKKKEELFSQYLEVLDGLYKSHNNKPAKSDVAALNEFWGMWLLTKFNEKDPVHTLKHSLKEDLNKAMQKLRKAESPLSNLHHYIIYGSELRKTGKLSESIDMYTKAIKEDHCWAAVAFYNRAFAWLTQQNEHQDPDCINRALEDLQNALKSVELYCKQLKVTSTYGTQQTNDLTRFDDHIAARHTVLESFKANISEAIEKLERARDRGGYVKVTEKLVYFLVSVTSNVWRLMRSVRVIWSGDPLKLRQLLSSQFFDVYSELRSLKAMGLTRVYMLDTLFSVGGFLSRIRRIFRSFFKRRFSATELTK
ncbi:uncharacterized protein PAE49_021355 [Odontesthes bonariensis]|uniref:uncharacterized protein LOC142368393 n=1 Tax=Odontesthes bonariensis TaxID=219752 RepID=UPI003F58A486